MYAQPDVSPAGIRARERERIIDRIMYDLVNNNICHYTDEEGRYNDNFECTRNVIRKHLEGA
jgi:hypothetical protein